jgi:hypothetical protein
MKYEYKIIDYSNLTFSYFSFKPIDHNQIFEIRDWRNKKLYYLRQKQILTKAKQLKYFQDYIFNESIKKYPKDILFSFYMDDDFIGYGGMTHIEWDKGLFEISYLLNPHLDLSDEDNGLAFNSFMEIIKKVCTEQLELSICYTVTYTSRVNQIRILDIIMNRVDCVIIDRRGIDEKTEDFVCHLLNFKEEV